MNRWRQTALGLYQLATWSRRARLVAALSEHGRAPVCSLFYHRVAEANHNPWTISTREFVEQLDWLARRFDFVSMAEGQRRVAECDSHRPSVVITFDDGYADNCEQAIPLLVERGIPTTYFVSTDFIANQKPFPHDVERGCPLRPNTIDQLKSMADAGVELGAHTRTHRKLGGVTDATILDGEIGGSVDDLRSWTGHPVRYFAFPNGQPSDLCAEGVAAARRAGLLGVCSAYGNFNLPPSNEHKQDPYHVRRIHGDPIWARFTNWMTIDTRFLAGDDRVDDDQLMRLARPTPQPAPAEGVAH
ncbi:MAG: polysaccharide deacetylase family protein [Lacipirellulaceae bacterium]